MCLRIESLISISCLSILNIHFYYIILFASYPFARLYIRNLNNEILAIYLQNQQRAKNENEKQQPLKSESCATNIASRKSESPAKPLVSSLSYCIFIVVSGSPIWTKGKRVAGEEKSGRG